MSLKKLSSVALLMAVTIVSGCSDDKPSSGGAPAPVASQSAPAATAESESEVSELESADEAAPAVSEETAESELPAPTSSDAALAGEQTSEQTAATTTAAAATTAPAETTPAASTQTSDSQCNEPMTAEQIAAVRPQLLREYRALRYALDGQMNWVARIRDEHIIALGQVKDHYDTDRRVQSWRWLTVNPNRPRRRPLREQFAHNVSRMQDEANALMQRHSSFLCPWRSSRNNDVSELEVGTAGCTDRGGQAVAPRLIRSAEFVLPGQILPSDTPYFRIHSARWIRVRSLNLMMPLSVETRGIPQGTTRQEMAWTLEHDVNLGDFTLDMTFRQYLRRRTASKCATITTAVQPAAAQAGTR